MELPKKAQIVVMSEPAYQAELRYLYARRANIDALIESLEIYMSLLGGNSQIGCPEQTEPS